ncbi:DUF4839 domain-containing protein [Streptomyces venezuelae]|uniref:DUF4839 domain-containing protein n=1 Tax=Streptomyces venezuelae TaxID=54571 RepID=A0A5P2DS32_STRVZ|nr:DUF4839 domain-containing protein [Streptomyces venezuelae]QES57703.1 DUF4839 domain-containing protein [Streptomyces venezuelae]
MADEITYEYKTMQAVRGVEGPVISKMRKDGWEPVGQTQGMLRTALDFRRPKKPLPRLPIGVAAGVLVLLAGVIGLGVALEDGGGKKDTSDKPAAAAASGQPSVSGQPSAIPAPDAAAAATAEVITPQNDPEFAALLKTADSCDDVNRAFAAKHKGRTVAFDGSIVHMAHHGDAATRYDFLLGPGDEGPKTGTGPAFTYQDVNTQQLKLTGQDVPAGVRAGDRFRFVAEVGEFDAKSCLFFLKPVSTETR